MPWPLLPTTRRLVGLLFLIAGFLLLLGQLLHWWVVYYMYRLNGLSALGTSTQVVVNLVLLITSLLMVRYGWRERRSNSAAK